MLLTHLKFSLALPILRVISKTPLRALSSRARSINLEDVRHEGVHPLATFAPWRSDSEFLKIYEEARRNTLVDIYRCYELWSLVAQAAKAGSGDILEVGVWRGGTGAILAQRAKSLGLKGRVYLADTFQGVVKTGAKDAGYKDGEHSDTSKELVESLLRGLGLSAELLVGIFPEDRPAELDQKDFIFCHIDVDVYESANDIFEWVWPRLRPGGIVVFDDCGFFRCAGITRLCEELKSRSDNLYYYNLSGHGVFIKRS